jgi:hypothetical protein
VTQNHSLKISKKNPTIVDFNEELKKEGVYDVPDWRFIQRLGDLRNMSVHPKEREPTKTELRGDDSRSTKNRKNHLLVKIR